VVDPLATTYTVTEQSQYKTGNHLYMEVVMKKNLLEMVGGPRRASLLTALVALMGLASPAAAQTASVRVVHGIPGADISPGLDPALPVDILVNDSICLLQGFTFGSIAGPYTLPAGTYDIKVFVADTLAPCSGSAVIAAPVPVEAGENVSIVAHLNEAGGLTAGKFVNDVSPTAQGMSRIIAHHLAAAPAVDVTIRSGSRRCRPRRLGPRMGPKLRPKFPEGGVTVGIAPAGTGNGIFARIMRVSAGLSYTVYAVGSLANGTFTLIAEPIGGLQGITIRL
jgi:hypothetical protein